MKKFTALLILLAFALSGCGVKNDAQKSEKITVAVSIPPEAEFVRGVCGDSVKIITVIPPGYSPETYEPTPRNIAELSDVDVYFSIGVPAEDASIMRSCENLKDVELDKAAAEKYPDLTIDGGRDPHIWLSVKRASVMTEKIAEEMASLDADNAAIYKENAEKYTEKLNETDSEVRNILDSSPCRDFVVFHPAFGYFADEYGLNMYALEKDGREPTAAETAQLIDFTKERGIKAVFYQSETDSTRAEVFAEEIGASAVELSPLAENYSENLLNMAKTIAGAIN